MIGALVMMMMMRSRGGSVVTKCHSFYYDHIYFSFFFSSDITVSDEKTMSVFRLVTYKKNRPEKGVKCNRSSTCDVLTNDCWLQIVLCE